MIVKNHASRPLILQQSSGTGGLIMNPVQAARLGRVVIPPGQSREVHFWDEIKNHDYYQRKLSRGDISTGTDGADRGIDRDFSTFGDTLKPPPTLSQNNIENAVDSDPSLASIDLEKSVENAQVQQGARRRGRPAKASVQAMPNTVADMVRDIGE